MRKRFDDKFNCDVYEIFAGEYYATTEQNVILQTLLGSCIAVCLKDEVAQIVGLNHFMLPSTHRVRDVIANQDARYGINAMEKLINRMMKLGANRGRLNAKVFGGGQVMGSGLNNVAQANIDFIFSYLQMEEIPIVAHDVGGKQGRKIYLLSETFDIYLKRLGETRKIKDTIQHEKGLFRRIKKEQDQGSDVTLFRD
ncbi:chemotaxis protein CheD [Natroniella sulfidigena]|uniref:chemotaxis protein CheD n=1 Tax=Natroniella sulfidigena TaxID=723921 RepID=UPI00200A68F8|nr:chemotaxis protein CheD [Natroniella sulfidigena]MCK8816822.1 chemotaxis protein CheD [Natroniella sulfidigena]